MSDSEVNTTLMETTRLYKDDLELSPMKFFRTSQDMINNPSEAARLIRLERPTFDSSDSTQSDISVDFVLVSNQDSANVDDIRRSTFEERIEKQGLILEKDVVAGLTYIKVHAPIPVLRRYCEILKLKMPIKAYPVTGDKPEGIFDLLGKIKKNFGRIIRDFIDINPRPFAPTKDILRAEYSQGKEYLFNEDDPDFFSTEVRTLVIDFILNRVSWGNDEENINYIGIQCLLDKGVYKAAYPLHDGEYTTENSLRHQLYAEWANMSKWFQIQPIDLIKDYLGVKYAFYFTWLGFYTYMLIPVAILGLIVFFYGVFTFPNNKFCSDICTINNTIMCPLCDTCDYWKLQDNCIYARLSYLCNNDMTVIFAFLMSIWATLYLELWKRYSATITHRWGLTEFSSATEHPRPQYLARVLNRSKHKKINMVTGVVEPIVPFWKKISVKLFSISVVSLLILITIAAAIGVVLYRLSLETSLRLSKYQSTWMSTEIFVPTTAGILNLICIKLLTFVYHKVAIYLTEMELYRTQTEFDESLSIKIYLFQFVNYYSSIFYVAFWKVINLGYPGKYFRIFNLRQEECGTSGCLMELSIQLFIIMVGEQAWNVVDEMIIPWFKSLTKNKGPLDNLKLLSDENDSAMADKKPWIRDYKLLNNGSRELFNEYLEMVMQYSLVILFSTAFPLGSFFALLNNVFEMRLDAKKILMFYRRPIPHRVPNIGVWHRILEILGKLAVITNAFIIAFSSDFVPHILYIFFVSEDTTDNGFLNNTLAYFDIKDFENGTAPLSPSYNVTYCRYKDYRNPPWLGEQKYDRTIFYYQVLAARFFFVVIFQNIVSFVKVVIQWLIPDVPNSLSNKIKRESYLTTQTIIEHEKKKYEAENAVKTSFSNNKRKLGTSSKTIEYTD